MYSPIDDFVMTNVGEFNGRKVVSAENAKIDVEDVEDASTKKLSEDDKRLFGAWLKLTLEDSVKEVKVRMSFFCSGSSELCDSWLLADSSQC